MYVKTIIDNTRVRKPALARNDQHISKLDGIVLSDQSFLQRIKARSGPGIEGSFSWIDHRFITGGFLNKLSTIEILLYLFLVSVSDRDGLSFYHDDRICRLLKIDLASLGAARKGLVMKSLLAYQAPIYQILSLPSHSVIVPSKEDLDQRERDGALGHIKKIMEALS